MASIAGAEWFINLPSVTVTANQICGSLRRCGGGRIGKDPREGVRRCGAGSGVCQKFILYDFCLTMSSSCISSQIRSCTRNSPLRQFSFLFGILFLFSPGASSLTAPPVHNNLRNTHSGDGDGNLNTNTKRAASRTTLCEPHLAPHSPSHWGNAGNGLGVDIHG